MAFKNAKMYGKFFSPEQILSYGRPWMFVVGSRSIGKTTGLGLEMLDNYRKTGKKLIYVRRTDKELQRTYKTYFDDSAKIIGDYTDLHISDIKTDGGVYQLKRTGSEEWEDFGYYIPLNNEEDFKSGHYGDVTRIVYDEFISKRNTRYLGNKDNFTLEYDMIHSLYVTVDRTVGKAFRNETLMYFSGNNASYYNPIYIALGIDEYLRTDTKFCAPKGKPWVVQQIDKVEATKEIENSWAYQLSSDALKGYNYNNQTLEMDTAMIEKLDVPKYCMFNMVYAGHKMGVYMVNHSLLYVCEKPGNAITYALTVGDQDKVNYLMAPTYNSQDHMKILRQAVIEGLCRFQNRKCQYEILNYLKLTNF